VSGDDCFVKLEENSCPSCGDTGTRDGISSNAGGAGVRASAEQQRSEWRRALVGLAADLEGAGATPEQAADAAPLVGKVARVQMLIDTADDLGVLDRWAHGRHAHAAGTAGW
jgi:hypothetical protein